MHGVSKVVITVEDQYPSDVQFIPPPPKTKWQSKQLHDLIKRTTVVGRMLTSTPTNVQRKDSDDRFPSARSISSITSKVPTTSSSRPQTAGSCRPDVRQIRDVQRPKTAYQPQENKRKGKPAVGLGMIHRLFEIWEPQLSKSYRKPAVQGEDDRFFRRRRKRQAKVHLNMAIHFLAKSKTRSLSKASLYSNSSK